MSTSLLCSRRSTSPGGPAGRVPQLAPFAPLRLGRLGAQHACGVRWPTNSPNMPATGPCRRRRRRCPLAKECSSTPSSVSALGSASAAPRCSGAALEPPPSAGPPWAPRRWKLGRSCRLAWSACCGTPWAMPPGTGQGRPSKQLRPRRPPWSGSPSSPMPGAGSIRRSSNCGSAHGRSSLRSSDSTPKSAASPAPPT